MEGLSDTKATYQGLTDSLPQEQIQDWIRQEKQASRHRGDALKIYEVQQEKGPLSLFIGSHDLDAEPLMQCHHRLTSDSSSLKMRMEVASSLAASPGW